jgi:hypothetical protein
MTNEHDSGGIAGYREFLRRRDGVADLYANSLTAREEFFAKIDREPIRSKVVFDRALYLRNVRKYSNDPDLDPRLEWILAVARGNQAERFGVELARLYGRSAPEEAPPEELHIILQESYHTRILADVVAVFGLPVPQLPPDRATRFFIKLMVFNPLPERFNLPLVGMAEMTGCLFFSALRDRGMELFASEPEVVERIRMLFNEILADELCHVGLIDERLGQFGRAVKDRLFRTVSARTVKHPGELANILSRDQIEECWGREFDLAKMLCEFPETAYSF